MGGFEKYLLINIIGFVLYLVNRLYYTYTAKANVDKLLFVIS